jgi:hypothetical protein
MGMIDDMTRREAVGLLLAGFPASANDGAAVALAYLLATEGLSDYAVKAAVGQFLRGEVPSHNHRFSPSASQLAAVAAKLEITDQTVRFVERNPSALEASGFSDSYRAEMRRRISELPLLLAVRHR